MKPLSRLGISREEKEMLASRLYPAANEIFLRRACGRQNIDYDLLEELDYSDHPEWKMKKMMEGRQLKANLLKQKIKDGFDISKHTCKYATFDEAKKAEPDKHIVMKGTEDIEKLNKKIDDVKLYHKMKLDDLSSDDEKLQFKLEDITEEKLEELEI